MMIVSFSGFLGSNPAAPAISTIIDNYPIVIYYWNYSKLRVVMKEKDFKSLLRYYLSCIDAEEAANLELWRSHENRSHVFLNNGTETLFSQNEVELSIFSNDECQKKFIKGKSLTTEIISDLYYGFPVSVDEKDILSPLFFKKVEVTFSDDGVIHIVSKNNDFFINRAHFIKEEYSVEKMQSIFEELVGEFGTFEARLKAAKSHIPSLQNNSNQWLEKPILFRANYHGVRSSLHYELSHLLKKNNVSSEETALKYFLQDINSADSSKNDISILEVQLLNNQQEEAVSQGLTESLSIVEGPPGTGKTQVVTALLASASYNNKKVLFASNNNKPVTDVYKRLGKCLEKNTDTFGNWLLRLGNRENTDDCCEKISKLLKDLNGRDLPNINLDNQRQKLSDLDNSINKARISLKKAIDLQEEISKLHSKEKSIEQKFPENWVQQFTKQDPCSLDETTLEQLEKHSRKGFWLWLRLNIFGWKHYRKKHNALLTKLCGHEECLSEFEEWLLLDEKNEEALNKSNNAVEYLWLHHKWTICLARRRRLEKKLMKQSSFSDVIALQKKKSELSQNLFEQTWLCNISNCVEEATESFEKYFIDIKPSGEGRYKRLAESVNKVKCFFPIWFTTTLSIGTTTPPKAGLFDLVVIDEAGQCDIPSVIPLLYRAKRAVIIGDPKQFKHITTLKDSLEHTIAKKYGVDEITDKWSFTKCSAFDRGYQSAGVTSFLKQHYRCHPDIIKFSNSNFYGGMIVDQVCLSQSQSQLPIEENGIIWHKVTGQTRKAMRGAWNPQEVEETSALFDSWEKQGLFADPEITYGIVTPFRKQVEEMRRALSKKPWFKAVENRFTIGTANSFQGSECNILVYSPVVAKEMEDYLIRIAATRKDLINVIVTRAKNLLYIVGDLNYIVNDPHFSQAVPPNTPLYKLAVYAEEISRRQKHPLYEAEEKMVDYLDELEFSYKSQYELTKDYYRLDFLVNSPSGEQYNIEVDGGDHDRANAIQKDEGRDAYTRSKGFKIIRFAARDVLNKPELVKARLRRL